MTTSSLNTMKDHFINSYIEFTEGEKELVMSATTLDEFDKIAHALVAKYNDNPIK